MVQGDTYHNAAGVPLPSSFFANSLGEVGGTIPPGGTPLVSLTPSGSSMSVVPNGATISGRRELDANLFSFRVGPYLDIPFSQRWMFTLQGGLAVMIINSDFKFNETVTINPAISALPLPPEMHQGSGSKTDAVLGGYIGGTFSYAINDRFRLFAGAQFQAAQDYSHSVSGKEAVLRLGESVFASLGASFSF
jgi:hypothetical protein